MHTSVPPSPAPVPTVTDQDMLDFAHKMFDFARGGDTEGLRPMLERGLPPNMGNHKGDTLLMLACYHGHRSTAELLLARGADPQRFNDMAQTPLGGAAYKGDLAMVELLATHGADLAFAPPGGKTPLMFAAMFNRVEIVDFLLGRGVAFDTRSSEGLTAQELASKMGAVDAAARLEAVATGA